MIRALANTVRTTLRRSSLFRTPALQPCLETMPIGAPDSVDPPASAPSTTLGDFFGSIWFAVPKKKVSRSKKRMKTTWQKKIKKKENIIIDARTGELTLRHHLPRNWKKYLPKAE